MKAATPKDEVLLLAKAIGEELHLAIANYQVFAPTGRDAALIDRVSALDFTWRWTFFEGSWELAAPSWSNSPMRSSGGTKSLLDGSGVTWTKSRIACFWLARH